MNELDLHLRVLEKIDAAFGEGDVDGAIKLLEELPRSAAPLDVPGILAK